MMMYRSTFARLARAAFSRTTVAMVAIGAAAYTMYQIWTALYQ